MANDMKQVTRSEETVVAGAPQQTVVTQPPAPGAPVQAVVTETPAPGDRVVARNVSQAVLDPAAERAATVDWFGRVVWFLVGVLDALLAIRFVLLASGANEDVGFAQLIYNVTAPFVAPFSGLFGQPMTYPGAAGTGLVQWEVLVAIVVYALIAFALIKIGQIMIGTNRNRGVVVNDIDRRTRI